MNLQERLNELTARAEAAERAAQRAEQLALHLQRREDARHSDVCKRLDALQGIR